MPALFLLILDITQSTVMLNNKGERIQPCFTQFNTGIGSDTRFLCRTLHVDWSHIVFMIVNYFLRYTLFLQSLPNCVFSQGVEGLLKIYKDQLK